MAIVPYSIIIPARYASTRLRGKPLLEIKGKALIQHIYEIASNSLASKIYIATDDERIFAKAREFGADAVMTSSKHQSGTDRLAEVVRLTNISDNEIIVNLQADEYALPTVLVDQVATELFEHQSANVATLCERIDDIEDYKNPNIPKVIFDVNGMAIYFSRSPIPAQRSGVGMPEQSYRHIGLYAYRAAYLKKINKLKPCYLENHELLEQLRILYYGDKIRVGIAVAKTGIGIDTVEDLESARKM